MNCAALQQAVFLARAPRARGVASLGGFGGSSTIGLRKAQGSLSLGAGACYDTKIVHQFGGGAPRGSGKANPFACLALGGGDSGSIGGSGGGGSGGDGGEEEEFYDDEEDTELLTITKVRL